MNAAAKIRATLRGELTDILILMPHPMENGQRKNPSTGKIIDMHFIKTFTVSSNGIQLIEAHLNTAISKDPSFRFQAAGLKLGDTISLSWVDNVGNQRNDQATVSSH